MHHTSLATLAHPGSWLHSDRVHPRLQLWGKVYLWQCVLLLLGWVTYVLLTIFLSKDEDKVMLDPLHHEVS